MGGTKAIGGVGKSASISVVNERKVAFAKSVVKNSFRGSNRTRCAVKKGSSVSVDKNSAFANGVCNNSCSGIPKGANDAVAATNGVAMRLKANTCLKSVCKTNGYNATKNSILISLAKKDIFKTRKRRDNVAVNKDTKTTIRKGEALRLGKAFKAKSFRGIAFAQFSRVGVTRRKTSTAVCTLASDPTLAGAKTKALALKTSTTKTRAVLSKAARKVAVSRNDLGLSNTNNDRVGKA